VATPRGCCNFARMATNMVGWTEPHDDGTNAIVDVSRLRIIDSGRWEVLASRCVRCGKLTHPARFGCCAFDAECAVEAIADSVTAIVSTQVAQARENVALVPPYQIVLARAIDEVVVRVPSTEPTPWTLGDRGRLVPLRLQAEPRPWIGLQLVRGSQ
jgi:uncharacterized OB-fold protein